MDYKKLRELACKYLGVSDEKLDALYKDNWLVAIDDWNKHGYQEYDKHTMANIVGLVGYSDANRTEALLYPLKDIKGLKVLDFGGGIGTLSIDLSKQGNNVCYYDLPSETQKFAKYLAKEMGADINFLEEEQVWSQNYDVIILADVLEHVKNPMSLLESLTERLTDVGLILTTGMAFSVGPNTPMHLPENVQYIEDFYKFMVSNFELLFYQIGRKELIYLFMLKRDVK